MKFDKAVIQWEEKVWGRVAHLFVSEFAATSLLEVMANSWCSIHYHEYRANAFAVQSGRIVVDYWPRNFYAEAPIESVELGAGESIQIPSMVVHRFRVLESGLVVETYWPDTMIRQVTIEDIVRFNEGGRHDS